MSTSTWSLYDTATGLFRAGALTASPAQLAANTPPGWAAIAGCFDHLSQKVDIAAGGASPVVVDYVPAAPADDALRTWAWNADIKRWVASPTDAAVAIDVRADRDKRLAVCDWVAVRAIELGQEIPQDWLAYRAALRAIPEQQGFPRTVDWPGPPAQ